MEVDETIEIPHHGVYLSAGDQHYHIVSDGARIVVKCIDARPGSVFTLTSGNIVRIEARK